MRKERISRRVAVSNLHRRLHFDRRGVVAAIRTLDEHHEAFSLPESLLADSRELSLVFLTDGELARLHAGFLADPTVTDVITFPGQPALGAAGEICISADAAARYAAAHRRDFSDEMTLYLVHGWLHLAGHDDRRPGPRSAMRRAEARALKLLREAKAMPRFILKKSSRGSRSLAGSRSRKTLASPRQSLTTSATNPKRQRHQKYV